jgi:hypothetical protein
MVAVFSSFATLSALDFKMMGVGLDCFKMMGVGLATAVLIDATTVPSVLLPAAMKLLERNWYLPRWLDWLPSVSVEARRARKGRSGADRHRPARAAVHGLVGLGEPVETSHRAAEDHRPVVPVTGAAPIDRILAISGGQGGAGDDGRSRQPRQLSPPEGVGS